jgi:hypothetical protein
MKTTYKRLLYLLFLSVCLALWISLGFFEAIEAPYVRF